MIISDDNSLVLILLVVINHIQFYQRVITGPIAMESIPLLITPGINESGKD